LTYATPPEYSFESAALLDEKKYQNFSDAHGNSIISFSQYGQDKIVENIFRKCGVHNPTYLDIGCNHPIEISNTALFYRKGSRGVVVDASDKHRGRWALIRPNDIFVNAVVSNISGDRVKFYMFDDFSGRNSADINTVNKFLEEGIRNGVKWEIKETIEVETTTINDIVKNYCQDKFPDFLSIDIEGFDLQVLQCADFSKSAPIVISIEGTSDKAISVLQNKGFQPLIFVESDTIAVRNDFIAKVSPCYR